MNPPHGLAVGREQHDGAVVDDDLHVALVVPDAWLVVLDRVARLGIAVGAAKVEEVGVTRATTSPGTSVGSTVIAGRRLASSRRWTHPLR